MEEYVYQAPKSDVEIPVQIVGSSTKGILYGSLIAFVGSIIVGIIFGIVYAIIQSISGIPPKEIEEAVTNLHCASWPGSIVTIFVVPFVFLGGYVCAKRSIKHIYRNVSIVCIIGIVLGWFFDYSTNYTLADNIIGFSASVIPAYLGAYVWQNKSS